MIYHTNNKHKKTGVAMLISDEVDIRIRNITRHKEEDFTVMRD